MKKANVIVAFIGIISLGIVISAWTVSENKLDGEWKAPTSADIIKNPLKGDAESTAKGKKLYKQMCAICHGDSGKGDGMAGMSLNPKPTDFTKEAIQGQTDGAIYWKMTEGKAPMAAYKNTLQEEQRWQLVNYIRMLNK